MSDSMTADQVLNLAKEERVRFLRLQFTDILGSIKNVEVPEHQFKRALDGQVVFDGSSIDGFSAWKNPTCCWSPTHRLSECFPGGIGEARWHG